MTLPLSKTLDPADFTELAEELTIVDAHFTSAREQHPMRRWEYAMALRAYKTWVGDRLGATLIYDIGGAGSPFYRMIGWPDGQVIVVDPDADQPSSWPVSIDKMVHGGTELGHAVFCLSVLEHVEDLDQFLFHLSCLVAPGGLLFLTMDCCSADQHIKDTYHFHWMRKRIFSIYGLEGLWASFVSREFTLLGESERTYHGDYVFDYSFASLALVKRL